MPNKKKRYYQTGGVVESLMNSDSIRTKDQSIHGKIARDLGREQISNEGRDTIPRSGVSRVARILSKLRGRMGGWDNRLRGPEEARSQYETREGRSEAEIERRRQKIWQLIGRGRGRASGGIIGLNRGGKIPGYFEGGYPQGHPGGLQKPMGGGGWGGGQQQGGGQQGGGMGGGGFKGGQQGGGQQTGQSQPGVWQGGQQQPMGQAGMGQPPVQPHPPAFQPYQAQAVPEGYGSPAQFTGYGAPTQMGVSQSFVAPEVASQYADLTQSIMNVGTRPFEQYQGPQLAGFTPGEAAAQAAYTAIGTGQGPQGTLQAESTLSQAAGGLGGLAPQQAAVAHKFGAFAPYAQEQAQAGAKTMSAIGAKMAAPGKMTDEGVLDPYASQYTQGVIDPQIRAIREEAARQRSEVGSRAAQAGAFGGYRHGLGEQAAGQAATQQIADVTARGHEEAFRSSQEAFQADRAAQAAGYGQQLGAEEQAGALGQQGFGTMAGLYKGQQSALGAEAGLYRQIAGVGGQQAALGGQQQQQLSQRLADMQRAGAGQRELQQAAIDIRRQQWEQQRQHPERQAQWISGMLQGLPYQNIQQTAAYTPQVGALPSAIGAGIAGAGIWNQFQANRPGANAPPGWQFVDGQWVQTQTQRSPTQANDDEYREEKHPR